VGVIIGANISMAAGVAVDSCEILILHILLAKPISCIVYRPILDGFIP
jgi:hypothetical protein